MFSDSFVSMTVGVELNNVLKFLNVQELTINLLHYMFLMPLGEIPSWLI